MSQVPTFEWYDSVYQLTHGPVHFLEPETIRRLFAGAPISWQRVSRDGVAYVVETSAERREVVVRLQATQAL